MINKPLALSAILLLSLLVIFTVSHNAVKSLIAQCKEAVAQRDAYRNAIITNDLGFRLGFVMSRMAKIGSSNATIYIVAQRGKENCLCIISNNVAEIFPNVEIQAGFVTQWDKEL